MKLIFKVILLTLIACSVFLIFSNVVNAEITANELPQTLFDKASELTDYYGKSNYNMLMYRWNNNRYSIIFIEKYDTLKFRASTQGDRTYILSNGSFNGYIRTFDMNFNLLEDSSFNTSWTLYTNSPFCDNYYIWADFDIFAEITYTDIWYSASSLLLPPVIQNFEFPNVVNSMVAGEYFDIIVIANDYANTDIIFHINNGTLPGDTDEDYAKKYKYIILNSDSPYLMPTSDGSTAQGWKIPKSALIPIYDNCVYNMWLTYGDNLSLSTDTQTLTTSFSELGKSMAMTDTQVATQDIANYLNNDEVNDADFDLPEIDVNDFTFNFFSSLVGSITDAFLDTTYDESITFDVRGTTYTIHSTEFDILGKVGLGVLKNFTALLWVFGIGYWIYCDARKRIMKLKEFNWTAMFADDISVDML